MIFEQRIEVEEVSDLRKAHSGAVGGGRGGAGYAGNGQCQGTEAEGGRRGNGPAARPEWLWSIRGEVAGDEVREMGMGSLVIFCLANHCNGLSFYQVTGSLC